MIKNLDFSTRESRQKFYASRDWFYLRLFMLSKNPLCEFCLKNDELTPANTCDHKRDIVNAPHLRLDPSNIQCLCERCHNTKSSRDHLVSEKDLELYNAKWNYKDDVKEVKKTTKNIHKSIR